MLPGVPKGYLRAFPPPRPSPNRFSVQGCKFLLSSHRCSSSSETLPLSALAGLRRCALACSLRDMRQLVLPLRLFHPGLLRIRCWVSRSARCSGAPQGEASGGVPVLQVPASTARPTEVTLRPRRGRGRGGNCVRPAYAPAKSGDEASGGTDASPSSPRFRSGAALRGRTLGTWGGDTHPSSWDLWRRGMTLDEKVPRAARSSEG